MVLIAVRQEVKRIDNSVVVHALELAIKRNFTPNIIEFYTLNSFCLSNIEYLDEMQLYAAFHFVLYYNAKYMLTGIQNETC